jgi:hypothetical protein
MHLCISDSQGRTSHLLLLIGTHSIQSLAAAASPHTACADKHGAASACRKYSIDATPVPWENDVDTEAMLTNLRTHTYQALVLDSPAVQYFAAQAEQCDLFPVGEWGRLRAAATPVLGPTISQQQAWAQVCGGVLDAARCA